MASIPYRFASWLLQKIAVSLLIGVLSFAAWSLWLFVQDQRSDETRREQWIAGLTVERDQAKEALLSLEGRLSADEAELLRQQDRLARSIRVIERLDNLDTWWRRWFGDREQLEANRQQRARMILVRAEAQAAIVGLKTSVTANHDGREEAVDRLQQAEANLDKAVHETSRVGYYLREAWMEIRWYLAGVVFLIFFGRLLLRCWLCWRWASWASGRQPLRLADAHPGALATAGATTSCLNEFVWPGECMRVRAALVVTPPEGLEKRLRTVLNWRFPFSCRWVGLTGLLEFRHRAAGDGRAVPLATGEASDETLLILEVPEEASFSIRLSHVAGLVYRGEKMPAARRVWRLFSVPALIFRQFRFFDFHGPCRLIVRAHGLRVENLPVRDGVHVSEKRLDHANVIGFGSNLRVSPARTERVGAYVVGSVPLWQARFVGEGFVLVADEPKPGFWRRLGRFIGL